MTYVQEDREFISPVQKVLELQAEVERLTAAYEAAVVDQTELERLREALERVLENARSWHGPAEADNRHAKALVVIANWCADALDTRTEEQDPSRRFEDRWPT